MAMPTWESMGKSFFWYEDSSSAFRCEKGRGHQHREAWTRREDMLRFAFVSP